ncbi:MAG: hypothetical protein F9K25_13240 [Candidatus Contendobacter sp.]|nr:MAG: hypothetical protein F9K25_13240 [Candidatus Contendobacter sp.]
MPRRPRDDRRLKTLIAQECARLIVEEGVQNFGAARRKAALRLAIDDRTILPDNVAIEQALLDRQRLFHADRQAIHLRGLRETALDAMRFLARFRPRLVGSVLSGAVGPHASIHLHLFAESPEEITLFLMERHIPFETDEHRLNMASGARVCLPVFRFTAGEARIDLTVFGLLAEREAPLSPVNGRPMRRADPAEVQALLLEPWS